MGQLIGILVIIAVVFVVVRVTKRRAALQTQQRLAIAMEPVKKLTFEDITALGEQLQNLDLDLTGRVLDEGARADYQRALDAYENAKQAAEVMAKPDDVGNVTSIVEDGRYAIACVQARVNNQPLPPRRPACFFDPRHGISVADVQWPMPDGQMRDVPACALDRERVMAGAAPDSRYVMRGSQRMPYWQDRNMGPYARGYFGNFGPMEWMFAAWFLPDILGGVGMLAEGIGAGLGDLAGGIGDGLGDIAGGIGDLFDF
ncbi:hypothetical protein Back2_04380 [Nocardioides baekrokdamisoli]|uniref:Uncharacterized protein n=1 Tax=Nocardioides baekrokdamisoli TaxID=1804624 RepID=A0A3G9IR89_9ACTN|nr:hypothetical protein [Nocardioides baekrokdamisoli]BBH16151.1 hypothetical protein Back2_04380 [Nocardioides baekrokdamisoli]